MHTQVKEETSLDVTDLKLFPHVYSDPHRDKRRHTVSVVYTATAHGTLKVMSVYTADHAPTCYTTTRKGTAVTVSTAICAVLLESVAVGDCRLKCAYAFCETRKHVLSSAHICGAHDNTV
jgi:ADP-ribose pyrophosphatase YjhB (NUDIX family)